MCPSEISGAVPATILPKNRREKRGFHKENPHLAGSGDKRAAIFFSSTARSFFFVDLLQHASLSIPRYWVIVPVFLDWKGITLISPLMTFSSSFFRFFFSRPSKIKNS